MVEYIVAIDVTRVRFPADAFVEIVRLLKMRASKLAMIGTFIRGSANCGNKSAAATATTNDREIQEPPI